MRRVAGYVAELGAMATKWAGMLASPSQPQPDTARVGGPCILSHGRDQVSWTLSIYHSIYLSIYLLNCNPSKLTYINGAKSDKL